jgi:hypothetical protein
MSKLLSLHITPMNGGFLVRAVLNTGKDEYTDDQYIVGTYAQVLKAVKTELDDFKPVRKVKVDKEIQQHAN